MDRRERRQALFQHTPAQNAKNIQEKEEQKFDEEKYQRLMEQKKAYEAQIAEEVEANRVLEAEMNKIKEKEVLQRRKQQKRKNLANKFFGTITKKKAVLIPDREFATEPNDLIGGIID